MSPPTEAENDPYIVSALQMADDVAVWLCRRSRCRKDELEDFQSDVHFRLLDDDCAVLRQFERRSALKTYLAVVVQRLFVDFRRQRWGQWRHSAEARRLGETAQRLEELISRDGLPLDEALEVLRTNEGVSAPLGELRALASRLPIRAAHRHVSLEAADHVAVTAAQTVEGPALRGERLRRLRALNDALASVLSSLPGEDALLLRLRFVETWTARRIAERLGVDAKPLYRRIERLLAQLREALERRGFRPAEVVDLLGADDLPPDQEEEVRRTPECGH